MGRRTDPFFGLDTPVLFAHRGGGLEEPESTRAAFCNALAAAAVLEIDVQVTKGDEQFVVWHGPELDNVLIEGLPSRPSDRPTSKNDISKLSWWELNKKAWVARPRPGELPDNLDLKDTPRNKANEMMLLEQVLAEFPSVPLNIEMKTDTFRWRHVQPFLELLRKHRNGRPIMIASQSHCLLRNFRSLAGDDFATGLSPIEAPLVIAASALSLLGEVHKTERQWALQTTYQKFFTPRKVIEQVHAEHRAVHVFITRSTLGHGIDQEEGTPTREQIAELIERGVDGIMTDRPRRVRELIDSFKS